MRLPLRLLVPLLLLGLSLGPVPAYAESFFDLFAGAAFTPKNDIELRFPGGGETTDSEFKDSYTVGLRAGYWFGFFGLNFDAAYFRPELDPDDVTLGGVTVKTDLNVFALGLNAMLRGQLLKDTDVPDGRLQPYVFGGPTLFLSHLDVDVSGLGISDDEADVSAQVGFTAGGGLTFMLTKSLGVFAEYRFTRNRPEFGIEDLKIEPKLDTHHAIAGLTLRF